MTSSNFQALGLADALLSALDRMELVTPTPIQAQAIPTVLAGRDVLGIAQTGTGKTAAFSLPVLHALLEKGGRPQPKTMKALVLAPTRELASQIGDTVKALTAKTQIRHAVVFGGVSIRPQIQTLSRGLDIVIATPGRLLDLMEQNAVSLSEVRHLVLDEADRMLDMGFIRDIRRVVKALPKERQSLLFSATMPESIASLAADILRNPTRVEVTPQVVTVEKIDQSAFLVPQKAKKHWLIERLADPAMDKVVVFTRTKHGANRLSGDLEKAGIDALAIHGNKSQGARQKALAQFHGGRTRVLVATDIVARGIHVDDISHVINFDLPEEAESYVHRIGRTARAGKGGAAIALVDPSERAKLKAIEKLTGQRFTLETTSFATAMPAASGEDEPRQNRRNRPRRPAAGAKRPPRAAAKAETGQPDRAQKAQKPGGGRRRQRSRGRGGASQQAAYA
ncbi:DEAD/DEAH box helicase [Consotaella aegiceratis]|uniref:DEAD/DEAH box helicase n=1 Tax=Consotaella aegiceratis TaxID=3097961 RepID=UPI002F41D462